MDATGNHSVVSDRYIASFNGRHSRQTPGASTLAYFA